MSPAVNNPYHKSNQEETSKQNQAYTPGRKAFLAHFRISGSYTVLPASVTTISGALAILRTRRALISSPISSVALAWSRGTVASDTDS